MAAKKPAEKTADTVALASDATLQLIKTLRDMGAHTIQITEDGIAVSFQQDAPEERSPVSGSVLPVESDGDWDEGRKRGKVGF